MFSWILHSYSQHMMTSSPTRGLELVSASHEEANATSVDQPAATLSNKLLQPRPLNGVDDVLTSNAAPSPPSPPPPPTSAQSFVRKRPNLPNGSLLAERESYINTCVPLYNASINGDWEAADRILNQRPELVRFSITEHHETALHIAASTQNTKFVIELINIMNVEDLELQNENSNTALCLAAVAGNKELVKILVNANERLLTIPGSTRMMPLYMAALSSDHDTVEYLYKKSEKMTGDNWTDENQGWVLLKCIEADLYDIGLKILDDLPELARTEGVLAALARKPYAFIDKHPHFLWTTIKSFFGVQVKENESEAMKLLKKIWKDNMNMKKDDIDKLLRGPKDLAKGDGKKQTYSSRVLFIAAQMGNTNFLVELIRQYPDLIWKVDDNNQSIFHIAVSHRHESIYNILHEIGALKDLIIPLKDLEGNNMLHLVGKNAGKNLLHHVSGDAFQMQWELLWFKEVEGMIPLSYRERTNKDNKTPRDLFTENHKKLVARGEKWMKGTANQSMVVAALIATIVFAVAFSIPGGYNQKSGFPEFIHEEIFIAFVISDAISLSFSSASILIFLSIVTSRYEEQDFFKSLPQKLMIGIATLFLSIMTMMIAFTLSFFVLYHNKLKWVPITISVMAAILVIVYVRLQYSLLIAVYQSIFGSKHIFKPKKRMLYNQTPRF